MAPLNGFLPGLNQDLAARPEWTQVAAERLRMSTNSINETCLVRVSRRVSG